MQSSNLASLGVLVIVSLAALPVRAQQPPPIAKTDPVPSNSQTASLATPPSTYVLNTGDQIMIQGPELEEVVNRPYTIEPDGEVKLPILGDVKAAGFTIVDFDAQLTRAASKYIRNPQLAATVVEFHSQPISVVGAVVKPGIVQLQGKKRLMEVLSMVGGFQANAGNTLHITRELQWGTLPLPNATTDSSGKFSVAEISIPELMQERTPGLNILMKPNDQIAIPVSDVIYVVGDVGQPGGYLLGEHKDITVLQAIALAQGISPTSDAKHSRVIHHPENSTSHTETPVDVRKILAGKTNDVPLEAGDILLIPGSLSKKAGIRTVDAAISTASEMAIWGRF